MDALSTAEKLKAQTSDQHQALEGKIVRIIKKAGSIHDYHGLLRFFYGFFQPVEALALKFIRADHLPDIEERRKSSLLLEDLRQTGHYETPVPTTNQLPSIHNFSSAFAAFYVLEGSTIGGKHILAMLRRNIELPGPDGIRFFTGYGAGTADRWHIFKTALNHHFKRPEDIAALTNAANETFQTFAWWAELNYDYGRKEKL